MTRLVRLFLIFAFCLIFGQGAFAENVKFVQIADSHVDVNSSYSQNVLKSAVEDINKQPDISFVIFTGDNINNPSIENLRAFVKIIKKLKVPYYIALGNHDVYKSRGLSKVRYYEILRETNIFYPQRKPNYKFTRGEFVFLVLDGAKEIIPGAVGYYRKDTLKFLNKNLSRNKKKQVVILQHFPVIYPEGAESKLKTHKTYKLEEYTKILDNHHNVLAVLSGHFHTNSETMKDGVYHISTPSLLTLPQSYKIIDIVSTKEFSPIIYTQLREFEVKSNGDEI